MFPLEMSCVFHCHIWRNTHRFDPKINACKTQDHSPTPGESRNFLKSGEVHTA